jgi:phage antirepressor YoqD-like protein
VSDLARIAGPMSQAMTVQQVAEALGYEPDTIRKKVKELFPELVEMGKATYLSQAEVLAIKKNLAPRTLALKSGVDGATTDLEMAEKALDVLAYLTRKVEEQRAALAIAAPKVEGFDALMRSDVQLSITDAAKHFGLHPKLEVFPYLRARGYLTREMLPTQLAIDAGYLSLKVTTASTGQVYQQAVVEAWQLERWRAHVVHQVKRFIAEARP